MSVRNLDGIASGHSGQVGVVENESTDACGELGVEFLCDLPQRAAALVAVEPDVSPGDVLVGDPALPRAGNSHDQDHLAVFGWVRRRLPSLAYRAEGASKIGAHPVEAKTRG